MEAKLAAYRKRKEEEKQRSSHLSINSNYHSQDFHEQSTVKRKHNHNAKTAEQHSSENTARPETVPALDTSGTSTATKLVLRMLKLLLWLALWGLFVELQFGAVFFAASLLLFLYFNTRTGPKDNRPSAYSVFNKDCERIQGTLTAEQMQKNMFGVPGLTT
ncbi:unnamed protein product [Candidula unifasciata]|uniref:SAYSvFN domain-containing protein n=1 Tax=Candidula unifasciata TaxID=100452 RepID=A0A8S3ZWD3_9EUPU|nr:unnamed protein product [Candidula unifasciata]